MIKGEKELKEQILSFLNHLFIFVNNYIKNSQMLASEFTEIFILTNVCTEFSERAGI